MLRCCEAIAVGVIAGAALALIGGYLCLIYGGDTILSW